MQGTRDRVLAFLVERHSARAEDLAEWLEITVAAVRRHLDHLRADGLIDVRSVHQATGRPYYAYFPTESAVAALPAHYADFLGRILRSVANERDVSDSVSSGMAREVAARHEAPAGPRTAEQRIVHVTESLRSEGILHEWHTEADGYHLLNDQCPYRRAAEVSSLPCDSDRKAIAMLLEMDVEQIRRIVDGANCCEYVVRPGPARTAEGSVERTA